MRRLARVIASAQMRSMTLGVGSSTLFAAQAVHQGRGQYDALSVCQARVIKAVHRGSVVPRCERLEAEERLQFQQVLAACLGPQTVICPSVW